MDYPGVEVCIKSMPIRKKKRGWYLAAIQAMERAALEEWNKER